eukprot:209876_1
MVEEHQSRIFKSSPIMRSIIEQTDAFTKKINRLITILLSLCIICVGSYIVIATSCIYKQCLKTQKIKQIENKHGVKLINVKMNNMCINADNESMELSVSSATIDKIKYILIQDFMATGSNLNQLLLSAISNYEFPETLKQNIQKIATNSISNETDYNKISDNILSDLLQLTKNKV